MQRAYGITHTKDGTFVGTSLRRDAVAWKVQRVKTWMPDKWVHTVLLLHRGVHCGTPAHWRSKLSPAENGGHVEATGDGLFAACTFGDHVDLVQQRLAPNLLGVVPDDAFLATVPLSMSADPVNSFVSIHAVDSAYRIGVVLDRQLTAVFLLAPGIPSALESHLGRIERYIRRALPESPFPRRVYVISPDAELSVDGFECERVWIDGATDEDALRSAGAALVAVAGAAVPRFTEITAAARFRAVRTGLCAAAASLALGLLLAGGVAFAASMWYSRQIAAYDVKQKQLLATSTELQALLADNQKLSKRILDIEGMLSHQTTWARFLQAIADHRSSGLFIQRLGSASTSDMAATADVGLGGWASEERAITDFITNLQSMKFLSKVQLGVIERDTEHSNLFRFKLTCTLKLAQD
jgi:Tfp pilus assembly protein PilN